MSTDNPIQYFNIAFHIYNKILIKHRNTLSCLDQYMCRAWNLDLIVKFDHEDQQQPI